jgi:hypothetical protein
MLTPADRTAIAEHLWYELTMLWGAAAAIAPAPSTIYRNCAVEAFALHARNLIDFFYSAPQRDDVAAAHFFSNPEEWLQRRPLRPPLLEDAKGRANKEVSHLTYGRLLVTPETKPWPTGEIVAALDAALRAFCDSADLLPERLRLLKYREFLP